MPVPTSTHNYKRAREFFQAHVLTEEVEVITPDTLASHYGIQARRDTPTREDAPDPVFITYTQEYVDLVDRLNRYADQVDAYHRQIEKIERIAAGASEYRPGQ